MTWWQFAALSLGVLLAVGVGLLFPRGSTRATRPRRRSRVAVLARLQERLNQAGLSRVSAATALVSWVAGVVVVAAIVAIVVPIPALVPLVLVAGVIAGRAVLASRIQARQRRLRRAWPGIVDHLRQAVRSGASIAESVVAAGEHVPAELQPAFGRFAERFDAGELVDSALWQMKEELADPVADRIVESLRMAHEVGGRELPAVLQSLQESVRADISVREDALAKQSWIRAASRLGVAAPWLVLLVLSGRQETITAYNSAIGGLIIVAGALVSAVAFRMMNKLGRLPSEQRWFSSSPRAVT